MKERTKKYIRKRAWFGLTILLFFMVLSVVLLIIVRGKILDNVQLMGEEAVKIFKNSKIGEINLILMDIQMPIMDGYMATKVIRELEREDSKNIEIIAMSANTFLDDIQKAKNCGMNDHIPKPIDIKKLMNI